MVFEKGSSCMCVYSQPLKLVYGADGHGLTAPSLPSSLDCIASKIVGELKSLPLMLAGRSVFPS